MRSARGFEELPHTADWALRVWAEDLAALLVEAAVGMNQLQAVSLADSPSSQRTLHIEAPDDEGLLVAFLSELLYLQERDALAFDRYDLTLDGHRLSAEMQGATIASISKPIKAVTYHELKIARTAAGCETVIVFDV